MVTCKIIQQRFIQNWKANRQPSGWGYPFSLISLVAKGKQAKSGLLWMLPLLYPEGHIRWGTINWFFQVPRQRKNRWIRRPKNAPIQTCRGRLRAYYIAYSSILAESTSTHSLFTKINTQTTSKGGRISKLTIHFTLLNFKSFKQIPTAFFLCFGIHFNKCLMQKQKSFNDI